MDRVCWYVILPLSILCYVNVKKKNYNCREAVITVMTAVIAVGKKTTLYYQIVKKL